MALGFDCMCMSMCAELVLYIYSNGNSTTGGAEICPAQISGRKNIRGNSGLICLCHIGCQGCNRESNLTSRNSVRCITLSEMVSASQIKKNYVLSFKY